MQSIILAAAVAAFAIAAPASAAQPALTEGTPVDGRWEKGDQKQKSEWVDSYTYLGEAGEELWIPWGSNAGGYSARLELRGPGGFMQKATGDTLSVRLPQAGKYVLSLVSSVPANYRFTVHRVTTAQAPVALVAGQPVTGGFTTTDAVDGDRVDTYSYTARADESVVIRLEGQSTRVMARVKFPTHTPADLGEIGKPATLAVKFPAAGTYPVMVSGSGGNYRLVVEPRPLAKAAPAKPLRVGEGMQLEFSPELPVGSNGGLAHAFSVDAKAGEKLSVVRTDRQGVSIWGPDGKPVAGTVTYDAEVASMVWGDPRLTTTDFTAPVSGTYRIEVPVQSHITPETAGIRLETAAQGAALMAQARGTGNVIQAQRRAKIAAALRRGEQLMNSGDYYGSIAAFQQASGLDTNDKQVRIASNFGAGLASYRLGGNYGFFSAKTYFESVLRDDPDNAAAKYNRDLAAQADADFQRNQQVAYEQAQAQRRQENAQYFSNMLNAFAMGVNLGNQINAANAPPPPAPAPAPAAPPAATYEAPAGQQASAPSSTGCAQPGVVYYYGAPNCTGSNQKTHNPANDGTNCVRVVPNPGNWGSAAHFFVNNCTWPVEVAWDRGSSGSFTRLKTLQQGEHYPTGFSTLPTPFPYMACKKRPEIGADIYNDNGRHICIGPAA